jgi:hypothetical protein
MLGRDNDDYFENQQVPPFVCDCVRIWRGKEHFADRYLMVLYLAYRYLMVLRPSARPFPEMRIILPLN